MVTPLPSKQAVLAACTGTLVLPHPVLHATYELSRLHGARGDADAATHDIDRPRAELVHRVDCWVSANKPECHGGAYLHSESVGMVIDRIAAFSVDAHAALERDVPEPERHYLWQRLAQLALAYADLAYEVSTGRRSLPDFSHPALQHNPIGQDSRHGY